ncbi:hypothetical protein PF010_g31078 [Phytophthora fragariae]|uniref:SET domain-containing protein n=1 Tax=Phytophthora fragariae TaxID=53985 RepID=A0A6G0JIK8_9STRA|nr:hypothetical protein PF010_g31078 [Phytophthora fragariae]KAE9161836.1 hypothetical protein PF004_g30696 [Phytophthora fragariae]
MAESHSPIAGAVRPAEQRVLDRASLRVVLVLVTLPDGSVPKRQDESVLQRKLLPLQRVVRQRTRGVRQDLPHAQHAHVVASADIGPGQVLGQYLGEMEHVLISKRDRPRNRGYRMVMKTRPKLLASSVGVAISAEGMGSLMRFVNHACEPVAEFREVGNGRCTAVVVATTAYLRQGQEITVNYGSDLWFICRCGSDVCCHRHLQDHGNP